MKKPLWVETGGERKIIEGWEAKRKLISQMTEGLERCPVCMGKARIETFGFNGNGIWVGCDKTEECSRYIERHLSGWSIADIVKDWNWRNSGWRKCIRLIKRKVRGVIGKEERIKRRLKKENEAKKKEETDKRREVFGVFEKKCVKKWWKVW